MTLTDWGSWSAIVAGILAVIYALFAIGNFILHKIIFRHPVKASYLIPQAKYPCRNFTGAPQKESNPKNIVVGIGQYKLMHKLCVSVNGVIGNLSLSFEGPSQNKPLVNAPDNPFIVGTTEHMSKKYLKDWWGNLHPYSSDVSPSDWYKNMPHITGHRITTSGVWKGKTCLTIPIQGEKSFMVKMDFEVSEKEDHIPFLKIEEMRTTLPQASQK